MEGLCIYVVLYNASKFTIRLAAFEAIMRTIINITNANDE
jgi:hypothetical protein